MNESSVFLFSGRKKFETGLWKSSTNSVLKGFKAWVERMFGAYERLAISLARRPYRTK